MKDRRLRSKKAPYHLPVFKNEYVTVLKINLPPHRNTGFHIHTTDSVSVNIEDAEMANQLPGEKPTPRVPSAGRPNFTAHSKQGPRTHKASNMGETAFHNVSFLFNYAQPGPVFAILAIRCFRLYGGHG
jgi:hypothetical protein